ncbi:MAG: hypothetical protein Faunusvirus35_2 [Faunusvirus sp.]|jgi:hypothetical protein|uniref:DUF6919 domain-containing protein n=1 Tax=Faunusvirus sp. TaxID=2487766 RepID=A0A3G5A1C2_9VIRU|nr:MAG: hypothetical protein Faunusvirus35_2 [Faunusvirus sp.]
MKFKDALKQTIKMFSTPEFIKRVKREDESMLKHYKIIKKINANGYLTTNSQAGRKDDEYNEKAYMVGFMLETKAVDFIKNMGLYTDKNAAFVPCCNENVHSPASLDIPLTTGKQEGKTVVHTHMSPVLPESQWHFERENAHISKTEKVVYIHCWDSKWNRNASSSSGLFTDVLKILKSI